MKKWPLCGVASLEGDNLVVYYYLSASEIWPDKRDGLIRGDYCILLKNYEI
jgi:hypothetical protein